MIFLILNQSYILSEIYFENKDDFLLFIISCSLIFLIGFIDDRLNLSPSLKLILISIVILGLLILDNNLNIKIIKFSFLDKDFSLFHYTIFLLAFVL